MYHKIALLAPQNHHRTPKAYDLFIQSLKPIIIIKTAQIAKDTCIMISLWFNMITLHHHMGIIMQKMTYKAIGLALVLALTGCSAFRVHTIDLPQGTPLSAAQANQIQVGMNANQVLYLLGSPALRDTLAPNRWDYIYDYTAGTDGKRQKKSDIKDASQYLSIHFNNQGIVTRIDGRDRLPDTRH